MFTNELPFMLEIPDGSYKIWTSKGNIILNVNSDMYKLHTARFAKFSRDIKYIGEEDVLQKIISDSDLSNYAFGECKTFISYTNECDIEFSETTYVTVTDEQCLAWIRSNNSFHHSNEEELNKKANDYFVNIEPENVNKIKKTIVIKRKFSEMQDIDIYYEGLNRLIQQSAHFRGNFWTHKVDINILEGTLIQDYIDDKFYASITRASLAPSILPCHKKFPELTSEEKKDFEDKLKIKHEIPVEEELIFTARSLWYRLEYRSAIIESSAALEIIVEKKLVQKMKERKTAEHNIIKKLDSTKLDFTKRCDSQLMIYTGKSFVTDNPSLWKKICDIRKNYRHKIVHSELNPSRDETEEFINDFESAIKYIISL